MLVSKLLVALFALPLAVLAQDAPAEGTDAAAPTDGAPPTDGAAPAPDAGAGGATDTAPANPSRTKSVGADINNTGHGNTGVGAGNWTLAWFSFPTSDFRTKYWVNNLENVAVWSPPYNEPVNLVLFNSNTSIFAGNATIATNIPAGATQAQVFVKDFNPGTNYILTLAPSNDPTRKIAQTEGFWIRRVGTVPAQLPDGVTLQSNTSASGTSASDSAAATIEGGASAQQSEAAAATPSQTGGARTLAASTFAVLGAVGIALAI